LHTGEDAENVGTLTDRR